MKEKIKTFLKLITPPLFLRFISKQPNRRKYGFFGNYKTWHEAVINSKGYDDAEILEKVKNSLLKVKNGEAVYERDSVIFNKIEYSWPLLTSLLWAAAQDNKLNIIDFGGSLGSSYYQNIKFLRHIKDLKWNVVEQNKFVDCGRKFFENNNLSFFYNIEEVQSKYTPNVFLVLGTIQYLKDPYEFLEKIINYGFKYVVFDRTTFLSGLENDRITIQKVPPNIYNASYPAWFLNEKKFLKLFSEKYILVEDFVALSGEIILNDGTKAIEKGFIFKLK